MSKIRTKLSHLTTKKVPALSLILVAMVGMVAGVLAANFAITQNNYTGQVGHFFNNTGALSVADNGLFIVSNAPTPNNNLTTSQTFGASGSSKLSENTLTAGDWMYQLVFTGIAGDAATHTVTINIRHTPTGAAPQGTALASTPLTATMVGGGAGATGTITVDIDLGVQTINAPLTVYVTAT